MKIKNLLVKKFRHIENQTIEFGKDLTVISGQNGTGKSSLLGWIAQAFDFKEKRRSLTGKPFKAKYSEVFQFCPEKDHSTKYEVCLTGGITTYCLYLSI